MNLLDQFILHHVQLSLLQAKLIATPKIEGAREAKVELKLAPRLVKTDSGEELPSYQVSARLSCKAGDKEDAGPQFNAQVVNRHLIRFHDHAKALKLRHESTPLGVWMAHVRNMRPDNAWRYIAFLDAHLSGMSI